MAEEPEVIVEEEAVITEGEQTEPNVEQTDSEGEQLEAEPQEFEIVAEGEEPQVTHRPGVERRLAIKSKRLTTQNDDLATQNEQLQAKIAALEANKAPAANLPPKPEDFDSDSEWQVAMQGWQQKAADDVYTRRQGQNTDNQNVARQQAQFTESMSNHYSRADDLITDHNVKGYDDAEQVVVDVLGEDATKHAILLAEDDSAKLMLYWGRNPEKLKHFKQEMDLGKIPNVGARIGRICGNLTFKPKQATNAPEPASTVEGNTSPAMTQTERKWRGKYEEAARGADRALYNQLKTEGNDRGWSTLIGA